MLRAGQGLIFDIQGFSVHDGPGCRTLVFMSGCPLRCLWCANPEGMEKRERLLYRRSLCTCRSFRCRQACPSGAINAEPEGGVNIERELCKSCTDFACVKACFQEALALCGYWRSVEEVMQILRRDSCFWGEDGGVTLGGGDPLFQADFSQALLSACRSENMHTALETSACLAQDRFLSLMQYVDFAFIDIKHMDREKHISGTGVDNQAILDNISALGRSAWSGRLVIRFPLLPGYNDDWQNMCSTAEFVSGAGLTEIQVLPFHRLAESKYRQLGLKWDFSRLASPSLAQLLQVQEAFSRSGVRCYTGQDAPF